MSVFKLAVSPSTRCSTPRDIRRIDARDNAPSPDVRQGHGTLLAREGEISALSRPFIGMPRPRSAAQDPRHPAGSRVNELKAEVRSRCPLGNTLSDGEHAVRGSRPMHDGPGLNRSGRLPGSAQEFTGDPENPVVGAHVGAIPAARFERVRLRNLPRSAQDPPPSAAPWDGAAVCPCRGS